MQPCPTIDSASEVVLTLSLTSPQLDIVPYTWSTVLGMDPFTSKPSNSRTEMRETPLLCQ